METVRGSATARTEDGHSTPPGTPVTGGATASPAMHVEDVEEASDDDEQTTITTGLCIHLLVYDLSSFVRLFRAVQADQEQDGRWHHRATN